MNQKFRDIISRSILLAICLAGVLWGITRRTNLEKNHKFSVAYTYDCSSGGRGNGGGIYIDYIITLDGKKYKSSSRYLTDEISIDDCRNYFIFKTFPVAYSPSNPSNSQLLIRPKDFEHFGVSFPDSLAWVLKFIKK
jgi:hypothetical protein